eukprot:TRINITY_DN303_c0_g2_i5.p1 TRINITY_DN303_c0_g2~~TRINITY_DN303_c0_g2_i5.p1  ORF type:complete len:441 (-),score=60.18 TRINITY_DN303_c0_g2_i5:83-1405(-)
METNHVAIRAFFNLGRFYKIGSQKTGESFSPSARFSVDAKNGLGKAGRSGRMEDEELVVVVAAAAAAVVCCAVALDGRMLNRGRANTDAETHVIYSNWFEVLMSHDVHPTVFKQQFRMDKDAFNQLVEIFKLKWRDVHGASSFTQIENYGGGIRKRLAVFLYICAHGMAVTTVQTLFAKSSTNVWHIFSQILDVFEEMQGDYIRVPQSVNEWDRISRKFEQRSGFPDACCAVDGTHVLIQRPNRKGLTSLAVQAVVDADMIFINVSIRPGCCNDKRLLSGSNFGRNMPNLIPAGSHCLGDSGYFLREYLLIPYDNVYDADAVDSSEERYFNYKHSCARITVERAFGILKGRFRILKTQMMFEPVKCSRIIMACMIMHNFIMLRGLEPEEYLEADEWLFSALNRRLGVEQLDEVDATLDAGKAKRDRIKSYLWTLRNRARA